MWEKLWVPALTTAVSLGFAAISPQDSKLEEKKVEKVTTVVDDSDDLADVYQRLRKIRAERLADRPKALSDQAARLYRQAVEATNAEELVKAKALTRAALELTKALELSLRNHRQEPADPELPPPPASSRRVGLVYRIDSKVDEKMPPLLVEGVEFHPHVTLAKPSEDAKRVIQGDVQIRMVQPDGQDARREVIVGKIAEKKDQMVLELGDFTAKVHADVNSAKAEAEAQVKAARQQAVEARAAANKAHTEVSQALRLQLKNLEPVKTGEKLEIELSKSAVDQMKKAESIARLHESLAGLRSRVDDKNSTRLLLRDRLSGEIDSKTAIAELRKAYETITKARKEHKSGEKAYLDAARDLYNTARREADAKHFDRAMELARAAESLTNAVNALGNVQFESRVVDGNRELKIFTRKPDEKNDGKVRVEVLASKDVKLGVEEVKGQQFKIVGQKLAGHPEKIGGDLKIEVHTSKEQTDGAEQPEKEKQVRIITQKVEGHPIQGEVHLRIVKPEDGEEAPKAEKTEKAAPADKDDAGEVVGIGVMVSFEDGKISVDDLIGDGPAGKDGRIKKGDSILGIETEKGGVIGFADKSLLEVTKLLRGPAGSKVKVIVQPKGSNDRKTYEIERKKLEVPKEEPAKGGGGLPPVIE